MNVKKLIIAVAMLGTSMSGFAEVVDYKWTSVTNFNELKVANDNRVYNEGCELFKDFQKCIENGVPWPYRDKAEKLYKSLNKAVTTHDIKLIEQLRNDVKLVIDLVHQLGYYW